MGTSSRYAEPRADDRVEPGRLAEEQAALRRVAILVAGGAPATEVFATVAQEVAQVLHLSNTAVCRYDDEGATMTVLAVWGDHPDIFEAGTRWPLDGPSMSAEVLRTGRPARLEEYAGLDGSLAAAARDHGFTRVAGAPIVVDGRVWGVVSTSSPDAAFPEHLEDRLAEFTDLVATAIANSQAREELTRLADEQAALRRVATLVARGVMPTEVLDAVAAEADRLLGADWAAVHRYDPDGTVIVLSSYGDLASDIPVGARAAHDPESIAASVERTGRSARIENFTDAPGPDAACARELGIRNAVGAPIIVEGRRWGVMIAIWREQSPLPASDAERVLAGFTELVATAIANAESREELTRLAEEQAALRRIATLVAEGARPDEVFSAVGEEVARLLGVPIAMLLRYDPDGMTTVLATAGAEFRPLGSRWPIEAGSLAAAVFETGRAARIDDYSVAPGPVAELVRTLGIRWGVGVPVIVDGALWGIVNAGSREPEPLPGQTEVRLDKFTQLLATAIANAEGRAELEASRARIVATADATRRRIERDLHDGAQQRLVSLALELRAAQAAVPEEFREHRAELSHVVEGLTGVVNELREIALGLHPASLAEGGLAPALKALARRSSIPVELDVRVDVRLPEHVEVAAYYIASEALTNAAKHARATVVNLDLEPEDAGIKLSIRDDGVGGAVLGDGSGLIGVRDRVEAVGGSVEIDSPAGEGTSLLVRIPVLGRAGAPGTSSG